MMAAPASPSPSLKDQGNDAFRASSWDLSVNLYTRALLDPTILTPDDAAALFSNRAAAYIHLFQFDRGEHTLLPSSEYKQGCTRLIPCLVALLDTTAALALRPTWSTAHARRAEVYAHLQDFPAALASCGLFR